MTGVKATGPSRRTWVQLGITLIGIAGLAALALSLRNQPWLREGILFVVAWQVFWWIVRFLISVRVWRAEPALSRGQKLWFSISAPLPVLVAVLLGRGQLSAWMLAEEDGSGE